MTSKGRLSTEWTKNLKTTDKKGFEDALRNSTLILGRLKDILDERISSVSSKETKLEEYDSPSWSHRQAHHNGAAQALKEIRSLLSFLDQ